MKTSFLRRIGAAALVLATAGVLAGCPTIKIPDVPDAGEQQPPTIPPDAGTDMIPPDASVVTDSKAPTFTGAAKAEVLSDTSIRISWAAGTDDVSDASKLVYLVYAGQTAASIDFKAPSYTATAGATSFDATGLNAGTTYFFAVRAKDEAGNIDENVVRVSATTTLNGSTPAGEVGTLTAPFTVKKSVAFGTWLFLAGGAGGIRVDDITDPPSPKPLSPVLKVVESADDLVYDDVRQLLYVVDGSKGITIINVANKANPVIVTTYNPGFKTGEVGVAIAYWGTHAYLCSGSGIYVIDLSAYATPAIESFYATAYVIRQIVVDGGRLYATANDATAGVIWVWDISQPTLVLLTTYPTQRDATGFSVRGGYAYCGYSGSNVFIVNFAVVTKPVQVGTITIPGGVVGLAIDGTTIVIGTGSRGFCSYNVSNPANPVQISFNNTPSAPTGIAISRGYGICLYGNTGSILNLPPYAWGTFPGGRTGVSTLSSVWFDFSKPMDPASLPMDGFTLTQGGTKVDVDLAWEFGNTRASITPKAALTQNTEFTVTLSGSLKDVRGTGLFPATGQTYKFTTAGPIPAPTAPTGVSALPNNAWNALYWSPVTNATRYNIYWSTTTGVKRNNSTKVTVGTNAWNHTGLTNGTTYYYRVAAENDSGESGLSPEISSTPRLPPAPEPVQGVSVFAGNTQNVVNWAPVAGAANYWVYWSTTANAPLASRTKVAANYRPWVHSGLTNGQTYYYVVTAENAGGESKPSVEASGTPSAPPVPAKVQNAYAQGFDRAVSMYWSNVTGASYFNVYWSTTPGQGKSGTKIGPIYATGYTLYGLTNGTPVYVTVSAQNAGGEGPLSDEITGLPTAPPVPSAPANVGAVAGDKYTQVYWTVTSNVARYNIYWSTTPGVTRQNGNKIPGVWSPFTHWGLTNGTAYYYVVTAENAGGESAESSEVAVTPAPPPIPGQPGNLTATAGDGTVYLTWDRVYGATGYTVYASTTKPVDRATATVLYPGVYNSYVHGGLKNGTAWYYVVTASNSGGESLASAEISATPTPPPAPASAPTITGVASNKRTDLYWNGVAGATWYNLYYSTTPGVTTSSTKVARLWTSYSHLNLTNGTTYYYRVTAENSGGESALSAEVSLTPQPPAPPVAPTSLRVTAGDRLNTISWAYSNNATSYTIYWANDTQVSKTSNKIAAYYWSYYYGYQHAGLTNGTQYCYAISATNDGGESALSTVQCGTPAPPPPPAAVGALRGTAYNAADYLNWDYVSGATGFNVYWSNTPGTGKAGTKIAVGYTTAFWHGALTNNTKYCYVVTAQNNGGESAASPELCLTPTPPPPPATPANFFVRSGNQQNTVSFGYVSGATRYNLYWSTTPGVKPATATKIAGIYSGYVHYGLTNGTTYYYVLTAENDGGESGLTAEQEGTPALPPPPGAPSNLTAQASDGTITLYFNNSSGATSYNLYAGVFPNVSPSNAQIKVQGVYSGYTVTGLMNGVTYYGVVTAVNASGESTASNVASATPNVAPPTTPTNLVATAGLGQASLTWSASVNATSYNVYWGPVSNPRNMGGTKVSGITTNSTTITGLTNGTTYYFQVTAVNSAGESGSTNQATAVPNAPVPTLSSAFGGDKSVVLSWTGTSGAVGYVLYRGTTTSVSKTNGTRLPASGTLSGTTYTDTGLTNGTSYYYVLTAMYPNNVESAATPYRQATPQAPQPPQFYSATAGYQQVQLSWGQINGATGYNIYWSKTAGVTTASTKIAITGSNTFYTHTGLTNGTTYYYAITAVTPSGETPLSAEKSATPNVPAPFINAQGGYRQVQLSISGQPVNGQYPLAFNVYYATATGVKPGTGTKVTVYPTPNSNFANFTHTGLTIGTRYYYVATAVYPLGETAPSSETSAQPVLLAPTAQADSSNGANLIRLQSATQNYPGATAFTLYTSNMPNVQKTGGISITSFPYVHSGLTNGVTQYYILSATYPEGTADSFVFSATPGSSTNYLSASSDYHSINLNWGQVTDAIQYNLYWSTTSGVTPSNGTKIVIPADGYQTTYRHLGLTTGTAYYYVLTAVTPRGESGPSQQATATVGLPKPGYVSLNPFHAGVQVSVQPVSGATGYNVYWSTSSSVSPATGTKISLGALTNYTHTGLTDGTVYYYVATAVLPEGESQPTFASSATPVTLAPSSYSANPGDKKLTVNWGSVYGATSYNVYWSTTTGVTPATGTKITFNPSVNQDGTYLVHDNLTNGTTYYYVITAVFPDGAESPASREISGTPTAGTTTTGTGAPRILSIAAGNGSATLAWDTGGQTTRTFNLYWDTVPAVDPGSSNQIKNVTSPYTHTGLTNGTPYYYVITETTGGTESAPSNVIGVIPGSVAQPSYLSAAGGDQSVRLTWSSTGATSYNLYWSTLPNVTKATGTKISVTGTSYTHTGLTNGTTYFYVLTAVNGGNESAESPMASALPSFSAPKLGVQYVDTYSTVLRLTAPAGAYSYNVYWSTTAGVTPKNGTKIADAYFRSPVQNGGGNTVDMGGGGQTLYWRHSGLTAGTTYYYVVTMVGLSGESLPSAEVKVNPHKGPATPMVSVVSGTTSTYQLTWQPVANAYAYLVYCSSQPNPRQSGYVCNGGTPIFTTSFTYGSGSSTQYFAVTALDAAGESAPSGEVRGIPAYSTLTAPTGLQAAAADKANVINWAGSKDNSVSYDLYFGTSPGVTKSTGSLLLKGATAPFVHSGLTNGTTYYYAVVARVGTVESALSTEASAKPAAATSGSWTNVGSSIASPGSVLGGAAFTVAGSTPYVTYLERDSLNNYMIRAAYLSNGAWNPLFPDALNQDLTNSVNTVFADADASSAYIGWTEPEGVAQRTSVIVEQCSTDCVRLGTAFNTRAAQLLDLRVVGGVPHVLYAEQNATGAWNVFVAKWNGGSWAQVGTGTLSTGTATPYRGQLTAFGSDPVVGLMEIDNGAYNTTVRRFTANAWSTLGTLSVTGVVGFSDVAVGSDGTNVYAAVSYQDVKRQAATVFKSPGTANSMSALGQLNSTATSSLTAVSFSNVGGTLHVGMGESDGAAANLYVKKLVGSTWTQLGTGLRYGTTNQALPLRLPSSSATPYVAFGEASVDGGSVSGLVRKYVP